MYNIFRCINFRVLMNFPKNIITSLLILKGAGGGGGLHQNYLEIDFMVVSDRGE